ncbi:MAG: phosphotransferase family protein [Halanaerobiaceae bacterium]
MEPASDRVTAFKNMWYKLIDDILACGVYSREEARMACKVLDKNINLFDRDVPASLLHMDIWSQNILIGNKGKIKGIVDWDRALWGDPEIEFAVLDYCGFNNSDFWRGYGQKPGKDRAGLVRNRFYHLYEVQKYPVIWTLRGTGGARVENYKKYSLDVLKSM